MKYLNGVPTLESVENDGWMFDMTRLNYAAAKIEAERSTLDNIYYPTKGSRLSGSIIGVLSYEKSFADRKQNNKTENYTFNTRHTWLGAKFKYTKYFNLTNNDALKIGVDIDGVYTTIKEMHSAAGRQLILPRYRPTIHSNMLYMPAYSASRYLAAGLMSDVKIWRDLSLRGGFYSMMRDKYNPRTFADIKGEGADINYIAELGFAYNTTIGPLSLALSKYNVENRNNLYLTFNFGFPIFSPRGTFY